MDETIKKYKAFRFISLISAVTSSGWSFNAIVAENINCKLFVSYLKEIMNFMSEQHGVKKNSYHNE